MKASLLGVLAYASLVKGAGRKVTRTFEDCHTVCVSLNDVVSKCQNGDTLDTDSSFSTAWSCVGNEPACTNYKNAYDADEAATDQNFCGKYATLNNQANIEACFGNDMCGLRCNGALALCGTPNDASFGSKVTDCNACYTENVECKVFEVQYLTTANFCVFLNGPDCDDAANGPGGAGCSNNGTCIDVTPGDLAFTCDCVNGYTDVNCQTAPPGPPDCDTAANGPGGAGCSNGGTCTDGTPHDSAFTCDCVNGYTGVNCNDDPTGGTGTGTGGDGTGTGGTGTGTGGDGTGTGGNDDPCMAACGAEIMALVQACDASTPPNNEFAAVSACSAETANAQACSQTASVMASFTAETYCAMVAGGTGTGGDGTGTVGNDDPCMEMTACGAEMMAVVQVCEASTTPTTEFAAARACFAETANAQACSQVASETASSTAETVCAFIAGHSDMSGGHSGHSDMSGGHSACEDACGAKTEAIEDSCKAGKIPTAEFTAAKACFAEDANKDACADAEKRAANYTAATLCAEINPPTVKVEVVATFENIAKSDLPNIEKDIADSWNVDVEKVNAEIVTRRRRVAVNVKITIEVDDEKEAEQLAATIKTVVPQFNATKAANPAAKPPTTALTANIVKEDNNPTDSAANALSPTILALLAMCVIAGN